MQRQCYLCRYLRCQSPTGIVLVSVGAPGHNGCAFGRHRHRRFVPVLHGLGECLLNGLLSHLYNTTTTTLNRKHFPTSRLRRDGLAHKEFWQSTRNRASAFHTFPTEKPRKLGACLFGRVITISSLKQMNQTNTFRKCGIANIWRKINPVSIMSEGHAVTLFCCGGID